MMQEHELRGILGAAYDETTDEQRDQIDAAANALAGRYPDDSEAQQDAMASALAIILGDETLESAGERWRAAQARQVRAQAALTGAIIASHGSERDRAERAGVARETVRKAIGR